MPIASLPCLLFRSIRSIKIFETIAVEDIVRAAPIINAVGRFRPINTPNNITVKIVIKTWEPPSPKRMLLIEFNLGKLNSNPIVNIKNTMPNSTKCLLDSESGNTPIACGPNTSPTTKYAIIGGSLK